MYNLLFYFITLIISQSSAQIDCKLGYEEYVAKVFPVQRDKCSECHDGYGLATAHAHSDSKIAYENTKKLIQMNRLERSRFLEVGGNFHCQKEGGSETCGLNQDDLANVIHEWINKEKSCNQEQAKIINNDLPSVVVAKSSLSHFISIDMGDYLEELKGAHLLLNLETTKSLDIPIYSLKVVGFFPGPKAFLFTGIDIFLNGIKTPRATPWNSYVEVASIFEDVPFVHLPKFNYTFIGEDINLDKISLKFKNLKTAKESICPSSAIEKFEEANISTRTVLEAYRELYSATVKRALSGPQSSGLFNYHLFFLNIYKKYFLRLISRESTLNTESMVLCKMIKHGYSFQKPNSIDSQLLEPPLTTLKEQEPFNLGRKYFNSDLSLTWFGDDMSKIFLLENDKLKRKILSNGGEK